MPYRPVSVKKLADNPKYRPYPKVRRDYSSRRAVVSRVVAMAAGEMKYYDSQRAGTALAATTTTWVAGTLLDPASSIDLGDSAVATPGCLCAPKVSASLNGRIGRKIFVHKIKIRGQIDVPVQAAQATADQSAKVRIVLVQDKQTNASAMTSAQLFQDSLSSGATTLNSFQNAANFGRFKILKEKYITLTNINMTGSPTGTDVIQSGMTHSFKINYRFKKPVQVNFNATNGGTVADIVDNSFHFIVGASSIALAPTVSYYCRVAYKE